MTNPNEKAQIAGAYLKVIEAFKKRGDVLGAKALAYRRPGSKELIEKNWFKFGDVLVTTGFCVCVSDALLNDKIFQLFLEYRNAQAKLVSIDIKEQFFGECKPSYLANKWHTAILLQDSGYWFIIDMTCAQFGNSYVGKVVWDLETWLNTFRSANDKHEITDFQDVPLLTNGSMFKKSYEYMSKTGTTNPIIATNLHNDIFSTQAEKDMLARFLTAGHHLFNYRVFSGGLKDSDATFTNHISDILSKFELIDTYGQYTYLEFDTPADLKRFVAYVMDKKMIPFYLVHYNSEEKARDNYVAPTRDTDYTKLTNSRNLVIKFERCLSIDMSRIITGSTGFIQAGTEFEFVDLRSNHNGTDTDYCLILRVIE